jgi:hypothetical protein
VPTIKKLIARCGLSEIPPDPDGLWAGLILPPAQYWYLWRLSWLSMVSAAFAFARGYVDLAFVPLGVGITSLLYWSKPDYSWRRYLDMAYVQLALWYQIYRAAAAENRTAYLVITLSSVAAFPVGVYFHRRGITWGSTLAHGMVHILGNLGNIVLYAGHVPAVKS